MKNLFDILGLIITIILIILILTGDILVEEKVISFSGELVNEKKIELLGRNKK